MDFLAIKGLVTTYMKRDDLEPIYPQIFELARERISKDARLIEMEVITNIIMTSAFEDLPTDFIEMRSLIVNANGKKRPLRQYTKQALDLIDNQYNGTPAGYTINGGKIEVAPVAGNTDLTITYYARPALLINDTDTNLILTNYPSLYLYAALMYAAQSLQDTETQQVSSESYQQELQGAIESNEAGKFSGDIITMIGG